MIYRNIYTSITTHLCIIFVYIYIYIYEYIYARGCSGARRPETGCTSQSFCRYMCIHTCIYIYIYIYMYAYVFVYTYIYIYIYIYRRSGMIYVRNWFSIPSCTRFTCTRTFGCCDWMFVLTSKHKQSLRKGVTSTKKSTYIRSTYKRECQRNDLYEEFTRLAMACWDGERSQRRRKVMRNVLYEDLTRLARG